MATRIDGEIPPALHGTDEDHLQQAFAGQKVGVKRVEEKIWLVNYGRS